jgi:hypothetical protein
LLKAETLCRELKKRLLFYPNEDFRVAKRKARCLPPEVAVPGNCMNRSLRKAGRDSHRSSWKWTCAVVYRRATNHPRLQIFFKKKIIIEVASHVPPSDSKIHRDGIIHIKKIKTNLGKPECACGWVFFTHQSRTDLLFGGKSCVISA